jgi:hypothetical protein
MLLAMLGRVTPVPISFIAFSNIFWSNNLKDDLLVKPVVSLTGLPTLQLSRSLHSMQMPVGMPSRFIGTPPAQRQLPAKPHV